MVKEDNTDGAFLWVSPKELRLKINDPYNVFKYYADDPSYLRNLYCVVAALWSLGHGSFQF